jgi:hypothetical protein
VIKEIQRLQKEGATLRFFNGADWYIEKDGIIHYFNTVFGEYKKQGAEWSKWYCSRNRIRDDFDKCIKSYLSVAEENRKIRNNV